MSRLVNIVFLGLVITGCQVHTTAQSPLTPGSLNQGNYGTGLEFAKNVYDAGVQAHVDHHSFFSFDLRSACEATAVTLRLTRGHDGLNPTFALHEVETPAEVVNNPEIADRTPVFDDLADGVSYGEYELPAGGNPADVLSFPLNEAGLAAFNAARGGYFTLGGTGSAFQAEPFAPLRVFRDTTAPAQLWVACVASS